MTKPSFNFRHPVPQALLRFCDRDESQRGWDACLAAGVDLPPRYMVGRVSGIKFCVMEALNGMVELSLSANGIKIGQPQIDHFIKTAKLPLDRKRRYPFQRMARGGLVLLINDPEGTPHA